MRSHIDERTAVLIFLSGLNIMTIVKIRKLAAH